MRTLATLLLLASLAACGGADQSEAAAPDAGVSEEPTAASSAGTAAPDGEDELRAAVQAYSDAFLTGDGPAAAALLSERCRIQDQERFLVVVGQAGDLYGSSMEVETFDAEIAGDEATVDYTFALAAINQAEEPWVRESGSWRNDQC